MKLIQLPDPQGAQEYFRRKTTYSTGPYELSLALESHEDIVVIDVRESEDFDKGHIPGAINLPKAQWSSHEGLRREVPNVVLCYSQACHLAAKAGFEFSRAGFPVLEMDGGWEAWSEQDLPVEKGHGQRTTSLRH